MKKLEGKVTVMTGAGCGYGMSSGFPGIFAKEGSHLVLNHYRQDPEGMKEFKEGLEACGVKVVLVSQMNPLPKSSLTLRWKNLDVLMY